MLVDAPYRISASSQEPFEAWWASAGPQHLVHQTTLAKSRAQHSETAITTKRTNFFQVEASHHPPGSGRAEVYSRCIWQQFSFPEKLNKIIVAFFVLICTPGSNLCGTVCLDHQTGPYGTLIDPMHQPRQVSKCSVKFCARSGVGDVFESLQMNGMFRIIHN
jgi:hypothetical protein